ncbi:MAG: hypothetical protein WBA57_19615 [Elainellaceae cyanobacterium]
MTQLQAIPQLVRELRQQIHHLCNLQSRLESLQHSIPGREMNACISEMQGRILTIQQQLRHLESTSDRLRRQNRQAATMTKTSDGRTLIVLPRQEAEERNRYQASHFTGMKTGAPVNSRKGRGQGKSKKAKRRSSN